MIARPENQPAEECKNQSGSGDNELGHSDERHTPIIRQSGLNCSAESKISRSCERQDCRKVTGRSAGGSPSACCSPSHAIQAREQLPILRDIVPAARQLCTSGVFRPEPCIARQRGGAGQIGSFIEFAVAGSSVTLHIIGFNGDLRVRAPSRVVC